MIKYSIPNLVYYSKTFTNVIFWIVKNKADVHFVKMVVVVLTCHEYILLVVFHMLNKTIQRFISFKHNLIKFFL